MTDVNLGPIGTAIRLKLTHAFSPVSLVVNDDSHKHAHHRGAKEHAADGGSGESHFHVDIVSEHFAEMSRLAKHRAVIEVLSEEMPQIHAFSLSASAP